MGAKFFACALWAYYPFVLSGYTYALPVVQIKISILLLLVVNLHIVYHLHVAMHAALVTLWKIAAGVSKVSFPNCNYCRAITIPPSCEMNSIKKL